MTTDTDWGTETPRLYVGTYGAYNSGSLRGKWMDLEDYVDAEEFYQACRELHKVEHDPEFMFQDFEGFPRDLYSESSGIDRIYQWIDLDSDEKQMLAEYADAVGWHAIEDDLRDAAESAREKFWTVLEATHDESRAREMGEYIVFEGLLGVQVPEALASHIDYASIGREWLMDMSVSDNGWVFTS